MDSDGNICFPESSDKYFLDWATYCKQERQAGVYALMSYACKKLSQIADIVGINHKEIINLRNRYQEGSPAR